ncbi:uncharacterized protein LOC105762942 isoform X1 [Gossypium raimondii]|uniref:uncharacterized protein LOC105762942 isoform X1 n=1 Tax=Gossypium raimondii TaxID=29730 RepID=UPI00063AFE56|nr:uncharacterized protein LOC105762942 isoform X1 [Gossypium raimondii]
MERFNHLIDSVIKGKNWEPLLLSRRCSTISQLFFADDLVLFCRADEKGVDCLNNILDTFCYYSGNRVSSQKTQVFFSRNVFYEVATNLCGNLGFNKVADLGKYLSISFFHNRVGVNIFQFALDKVRSRLNGCEARKFSLAGHLTLVKGRFLQV